MRALAAVLLLAALALAGCLGGSKPAEQHPGVAPPKEITSDTEHRFEELTQEVPSNYTFAGQQALDPVSVTFNDTVDFTADLALESPHDDGGVDFNTPFVMYDVAKYVPPGQPTEIHLKLKWQGDPGQAVDLDIATDLPGAVNQGYDPNTPQDWNWNVPVKRMVVDTIGVQGKPAKVGVQVTNGHIVPGETVPFTLEADFAYAQDVLTPYHPWAFRVPDGASGIVLRSEKVTGDEHIQADFLVLGPQDDLVSYTHYNDLAIPTESVFVPVRGPGEYVFYAERMTGGFLRLKADVPVPDRAAYPLPLKETRVVDFTGNPLAPGVVGHDLPVSTGLGLPTDGTVNVTTPYSEGAKASFTLDRFPLRLDGFFDSAGGVAVAGDCEEKILNAKGVEFDMTRSARVDTDMGSVGWSGDHGVFRVVNPALLAKGPHTVSVVMDGCTADIGHTVLTFDRGTAATGGK